MVRKKLAPNKIALLLLGFYKYCISPMLGAHCRFQPTCSEYAKMAFERFGFFKGLWLTLKRLFRCHPFCKGGFDPVPQKEE